MTLSPRTVFSIVGWASPLAVVLFLGCGAKTAPALVPDAPTAPNAAAAPGAPAAPGATGAKGRRAVAKIATTSDGGVSGQATFVAQGGDQVEVALEVSGMTPGQRAWHIHQGTSCGRDKLADGGIGGPGTAAGPHWNPGKMAHGLPGTKMHHAGDFGNFTVDSSGKGSAKLTASGFTLEDTGETSALGHALIIHGGTDNGGGENGDAGPRVGCGIIEKQ